MTDQWADTQALAAWAPAPPPQPAAPPRPPKVTPEAFAAYSASPAGQAAYNAPSIFEQANAILDHPIDQLAFQRYRDRIEAAWDQIEARITHHQKAAA